MTKGRRPLPKKVSDEVREQVFFAGQACLEKKANDAVVLDLKGVTDVADFFLIAEGFTDIHVKAVANHVIDRVLEVFGAKPWHVEGMESGRWVLIDFVDFVVHVFQPEQRKFYQLERLWADAERHVLEDELIVQTSQK